MALREGTLDPLGDPLARVIAACVRSGCAGVSRGARGAVAGGGAGSTGRGVGVVV